MQKMRNVGGGLQTLRSPREPLVKYRDLWDCYNLYSVAVGVLHTYGFAPTEVFSRSLSVRIR
jgi:hypothetical protein